MSKTKRVSRTEIPKGFRFGIVEVDGATSAIFESLEFLDIGDRLRKEGRLVGVSGEMPLVYDSKISVGAS